MLMSMFMLMLLAFPLEAKDVDFAVLSESLMENSDKFADLDAAIATVEFPKGTTNKLDYYFRNGDLTLQPDQEFIIRGGGGSIGRELDRYKLSNIILNTGGRNSLTLNAYGCYRKRPIGKENITYVFLRSSSWAGESLCRTTLGRGHGISGQNPIVVKSVIGALGDIPH